MLATIASLPPLNEGWAYYLWRNDDKKPCQDCGNVMAYLCATEAPHTLDTAIHAPLLEAGYPDNLSSRQERLEPAHWEGDTVVWVVGFPGQDRLAGLPIGREP